MPEADRKDLVGTLTAREETERLVKRNGHTAGLPVATRQQLSEQLVAGLLTQLRSYPIGMRIDTWIHTNISSLGDLQQSGVARQQEESREALAPEIKSMAPKPIFEANATMNAAYAIFADRLLGKAGYAIPYRSAGLEKPGRRLLNALESIPNEPTRDTSLVDAWAEHLGLSGWYEWIAAQP